MNEQKRGIGILYDDMWFGIGQYGYYRCRKWIKGKSMVILFHRYIWEKYNGEIPKGIYIHHKDGNIENNNIENLESITSQEHSRLHNKGRKPSKSTKIKMSNSAKIRWENNSESYNTCGTRHSSETRAKMKEAWRLRKLNS